MIITFSGKKQSGKSSACNFVAGQYLLDHEYISEFSMDDNGKLVLNKEVEAPVLFVNFADELKAFCVNVLGLTINQVNGSDEDKNTYTQYNWESFPRFTTQEINLDNTDCSLSGPMTARDVMKTVGESFRKADPDVWVKSCLKKIVGFDGLVLISDCRFPNEVDAINKIGGIVVRLTMNRFDDQDKSEVALDNYQFDYVIDNQNLSIDEKNQAIFNLLKTVIK